MTPAEIIVKCDKEMSIRGAHARILIIMPGKWGKSNLKPLCEGGPWGEICMRTNDRQKLYVMFWADEVKTYLEDMKNGNFTGRIGN